jgi:ABC-type polar amino acid transport system ATPase subunit
MTRKGNILVEVKGLHKHFDDVLAVNGVDFEVHQNEVVVIVGASGSGKSTVLRCINRLEEPTAGQIIFDDQDITSPDIDINQIRSEIGFVWRAVRTRTSSNPARGCLPVPAALYH